MGKNTGDVEGRAVPQLYLEFAPAAEEPAPILKAFEKTGLLAPGASTKVSFHLTARDMSYWSPTAGWIVSEREGLTAHIGSSSASISVSLPLVTVPIPVPSPTPAPTPLVPTSVPSEDCPGGSLSACVDICPSGALFQICVDVCTERCPGGDTSCTGVDDGADLESCARNCPSGDKFQPCVSCCSNKYPSETNGLESCVASCPTEVLEFPPCVEQCTTE